MAESPLSMDASWKIRKEDLIFEPVEEKSFPIGRYGQVFKAKWFGIEVAAKRLYKGVWPEDGDASSKTVKSVENFLTEYFPMSRVRHPHIGQLYGVYVPDDQPDACPVIIMELLDKTLRHLIINSPCLPLLKVIDFSLQITSALCYLHGQKPPITHLGLTSNNIMLTSNGACKVVDVGLAKIFDQAAQTQLTPSRSGHISYMPVEVLSGIGEYDERVDVFSFNIIMLEMCIGRVSMPRSRWWRERPGGGWIPIAESERREADLAYLKDDHPLKQLIVSLMQSQSSLPSVTTVHGQLHSLRGEAARDEAARDEVARRSHEEAQAMQRHFAEKEEVTRQENDQLKKTICGVNGVMQELAESVKGSQVSHKESQTRVEEGIARLELTLRSMEERIGGIRDSVVRTNANVEEVSGRQQRMQETLCRTEERVKVVQVSSEQQKMQEILRRSEEEVDSLHENGDATSAKAEEVANRDVPTKDRSVWKAEKGGHALSSSHYSISNPPQQQRWERTKLTDGDLQAKLFIEICDTGRPFCHQWRDILRRLPAVSTSDSKKDKSAFPGADHEITAILGSVRYERCQNVESECLQRTLSKWIQRSTGDVMVSHLFDVFDAIGLGGDGKRFFSDFFSTCEYLLNVNM